jgi:phosphotransferase system  glucose/maltose/N-acetylglucosamine-specific IIC component
MDLVVTLVTLAGKDGPNLFQWIGIIIAGAIISVVLFLIALITIIGGHRFSPGAKFLWILGILPWLIVGPLFYLLIGRHMKFIRASVRAEEDAPPAIEPPKATEPEKK